jgi:integrase
VKLQKVSKPAIKAVKVDANKCVIPKGSQDKPRYWRVNLGKKLTGTTKQRKFFNTEREANDFISDLGETLGRKGKAAFSIGDSLAHEALALTKELQPFNVSLTHAVHFFIKHAPKLQGVKVTDLIPAYLNTKEADKYRKAQKISLNVFARDFGNKTVASILSNKLKSWFDDKDWNALNERNYMRDISMFFKWCKFNDYCVSNPMEKVSRPKVKIRTPSIYSVEEASKLLETAKKHEKLGLFEFVAFAFFAGIRVEELEKMTWEMVRFDQAELHLPGYVTKTAELRMIPILDALRAWVAPPKNASGPLFVLPNLRNRKGELFKLAKVEMKRNAFRHTFASYHAAYYRDATDLQMTLGQRTPSVLFKHYVTATKKEDAARFFTLRPES